MKCKFKYYINIKLNYHIRFWGKILGKSKNYYIIEGNLSEHELKRRQEVKLY